MPYCAPLLLIIRLFYFYYRAYDIPQSIFYTFFFSSLKKIFLFFEEFYRWGGKNLQLDSALQYSNNFMLTTMFPDNFKKYFLKRDTVRKHSGCAPLATQRTSILTLTHNSWWPKRSASKPSFSQGCKKELRNTRSSWYPDKKSHCVVWRSGGHCSGGHQDFD